jgi:accessory gene regulator B
MIEKFCTYLTKKIGKEMPELTEERLEAINYGLQNIIGEIPKIFITIGIGFLLGIGKLTLLSILIISIYKCFAGGVHAKTHIGCITSTTLIYCGSAIFAKYMEFPSVELRYISIIAVWIFSVIMIKLYAPADTENLPILRKKERKQKQILSFAVVTIELIVAAVIQDSIISNLIIIGMFISTFTITKIAYRITKNKYGYEVYGEN